MDSDKLKTFNRSESLKVKTIVFAFVVFVPLALITLIFLKNKEKEITTPLVSAIKSSEINGILCSDVELDIGELNQAFDGLFTSKDSGSHPTEKVSIKLNEVERKFGRDSLDPEVIWVMPEGKNGDLQLLVGGYVRSKYISEKINECDSRKNFKSPR